MDEKADIELEKADKKIDERSSTKSGSVRRIPPGPKQGHRRKRTAFTVRQLGRMEAVFQWNKYPGVTVREALATELGISETSVQVWFQNRRSKWRKREQNKRPTHRVEKLDACSFNTYNTAERSWPLPQLYGQEEDESERIGQIPFTLKSDDSSPSYIDLDQVPKIKMEAIQRERSAEEIIGANGLLCMRGRSSLFMPSN
ncbi:hypothetical protein ACROYT_G006202 [Oculina patagonica]